MKPEEAKDAPLVSIVVVTYNSAAFVIETLDSIKEQTYQNIELIVSDDNSTDNTIEVCNVWLSRNGNRFSRVELVTSSINTGIAPNFNRGIRVAKGEWIKTIAGDDALTPHVIEKYIEYVKQSPDALFLHSDVIVYKDTFVETNRLTRNSRARLKINREETNASDQFEILLRQSQIWAATVMMKREVFDRVGLFDESIPMWEDRPMWLKVTKANIKLHFLNTIGAKYRVSSSSIQTLGKYSKLFSRFDLIVYKAYYEKYLIYLPFPERVAKGLRIKRNLYMEKYGFNNRSKLITLFVLVTNKILDLLVVSSKKKYL